MLTKAEAFGSFSVDDLDAAKKFYGETLGLEVSEGEMGMLDIRLGNGSRLFVYTKPNHQPASFTVLNFAVDDLERSVDELNARGVETKIYADDELPDMPPNDAKGIMRGETGEPEIAWFKDPAGNVLALVRARAS